MLIATIGFLDRIFAVLVGLMLTSVVVIVFGTILWTAGEGIKKIYKAITKWQ